MEDLTIRKVLNNLNVVPEVIQWAEEFCNQHHVSRNTMLSMLVAVEEILVNIISYGYEDGRDHEIRIELSCKEGKITAAFTDDGKPFNILEMETPDITAPADDRPIGGLGIHLTRSMMDEVNYKREEGKNVLILRKKSNPSKEFNVPPMGKE